MPKNRRLTGDEMKNVRGTRTHGAFFTLMVARIDGRQAKGAVVVSKKVAGKAVERNVIQRRARSVLIPIINPINEPLAVILYAKQGAAQASFLETKNDILKLVARVPALAGVTNTR